MRKAELRRELFVIGTVSQREVPQCRKTKK